MKDYWWVERETYQLYGHHFNDFSICKENILTKVHFPFKITLVAMR